ncbi:MAG TPA: tetratricopeptide repeat protein [Thermoanaerobaculia bacterium]
MKRIPLIAIAALLAAGCSLTKVHSHPRSSNPYANPFYARFLHPGVPLDMSIQRDIDILRTNPNSAVTHNDLGQLLIQKGFPKDAETEFERAVDADRRFPSAWYNLGLARASRGDTIGARFAFNRTLYYRPGDSWAHFQSGLLAEQRGDIEAAIDHYAKAILRNHSLLDVKVNPRVLDSKIIDLALIRAYPNEHARDTMLFQGTPPGYGERNSAAEPQAVSPQPSAEKIITPAPPLTDPSRQTPPKKP